MRSSGEDLMGESDLSVFWLWVAVTGVGWSLSVWFASSWLFFIGFLGMATGQWLLLRRWHVERVDWWIPVTLVSVVVGIAVGGIMGGSLQDRLDGVAAPGFGTRSPFAPGRSFGTYAAATALAGAALGSAIATAQWRILRRQAAHEWCWLTGNIVTVSLASVYGEVFWFYHGRSVGSIFVHMLLVGLGVGVGTGAALMHCLLAGRARARKEDSGHPEGRGLTAAGSASKIGDAGRRNHERRGVSGRWRR
jgi:hypothetical protein